MTSSANHTLVPIHCRVAKNLSDFDGAWTVSNSSEKGLSTHIDYRLVLRRCGKVSISIQGCVNSFPLITFINLQRDSWTRLLSR